MEHVAKPLARIRLKLAPRVRRLAPLEPDAFLAWAWRTGPKDKGTSPLTLDDVLFELQRLNPETTREELHRHYIRIAAKVRRNQRRNLDPWEGI